MERRTVNACYLLCVLHTARSEHPCSHRCRCTYMNLCSLHIAHDSGKGMNHILQKHMLVVSTLFSTVILFILPHHHPSYTIVHCNYSNTKTEFHGSHVSRRGYKDCNRLLPDVRFISTSQFTPVKPFMQKHMYAFIRFVQIPSF